MDWSSDLACSVSESEAELFILTHSVWFPAHVSVTLFVPKSSKQPRPAANHQLVQIRVTRYTTTTTTHIRFDDQNCTQVGQTVRSNRSKPSVVVHSMGLLLLKKDCNFPPASLSSCSRQLAAMQGWHTAALPDWKCVTQS